MTRAYSHDEWGTLVGDISPLTAVEMAAAANQDYEAFAADYAANWSFAGESEPPADFVERMATTMADAFFAHETERLRRQREEDNRPIPGYWDALGAEIKRMAE